MRRDTYADALRMRRSEQVPGSRGNGLCKGPEAESTVCLRNTGEGSKQGLVRGVREAGVGGPIREAWGL